MSSISWKRAAACLAIGLSLSSAIRADEVKGAVVNSDDAFNFFLQEAEVVTASRRAQKKSDSPVAIDVITREEIVQSGALNLWDLLRFRVGLDVSESVSIEGNVVQLNVRGLPSEFTQSLQVLIDGRSVVSGANNGIFWRNLPVALDDIERIEIVRGPNSALFGANAGQGVINIITQRPTAGFKGAYRAQAGERGLFNTHVELGWGSETAAWRLSVTEARQGSNPQPNGDDSLDLSSTSVDERVLARGDLRLWEGGQLELHGGVGRRAYRIPNPTGFLNPGPPQGRPGEDGQGFGMLQLRQAFGEQNLELTLAGRDGTAVYNGSSVRETVQDADLVGRFSLFDGSLQSTLGGSLRHIRAESPFLFNYAGLGDGADAEENRLGRLYTAQSYALTDWLSLAAAASLESNDLAGQWPAYQGAVILKALDGHTLRVSGSKSPSMPSLLNSRGDVFIRVAPNFLIFPVGVVAQGKPITPAQVASYEATWTSALLDRKLNVELTGYQMEIEGHIGLEGRPAPVVINMPFPLPFAPLGGGKYALVPSYVEYANSTSLVLRGVETVLTFKPLKGSTIQVNHTYEDVYFQNPENPHNPFIEYTTPWNKVNLIAQSELPWGLNAAVGVNWVGRHISYLASQGIKGWVEDQAKVDLRLGWKPLPDVELFAAGINLDHENRTEGFDGTSQAQLYYGGVNVAWGGK
jgi:iron complex outermembrane receptor protein